MSSKQHKFLVYAPDETDEGAFARRMKVRPQHLARMAKLKESGRAMIGSAFMTPESVGAEFADQRFIGSVMIFVSETIEEVWMIVETDVFYNEHVWDLKKLVITPIVI